MKKTKARAYTKLSRRDRAEQAAKEGLTPEEAPTLPVALPAVKAVKQKPGPLTLDDMRSEMLKRAGFSLSLMKGAIDALERNLTGGEPYAELTAAKMILQLSNSFPSKQAPAPEKLAVTVSFKPFAQVVQATALPALPEGPEAEDAVLVAK